MLSQWYLYFSTTSSIFCLQSTLRSVLLMIYVEPLDAQASFMFICQYLDYFGEPAVVMVLACGNMLCALILWIFGVYGRAAGLVGIICCFYSVQQAILTFFYVSSFKVHAPFGRVDITGVEKGRGGGWPACSHSPCSRVFPFIEPAGLPPRLALQSGSRYIPRQRGKISERAGGFGRVRSTLTLTIPFIHSFSLQYPGGRTPEYFARLKEGIKDAHLYRPE